MNQRSAISMGVVRLAVNMSAGRSGCSGRLSVGPHAASWIHSCMGVYTGLSSGAFGCVEG